MHSRKSLSSFHIVYSNVHCTLLLVNSKVIELVQFMTRYLLRVMHTILHITTYLLHHYFTSWNNHFGRRLSYFGEILLKVNLVILELLLLFCTRELKRFLRFLLDFAVILFIFVHDLFQRLFCWLLLSLLLALTAVFWVLSWRFSWN